MRSASRAYASRGVEPPASAIEDAWRRLYTQGQKQAAKDAGKGETPAEKLPTAKEMDDIGKHAVQEIADAEIEKERQAEKNEAIPLEILGRRLGITRERARQLESRARRKLAAAFADLVEEDVAAVARVAPPPRRRRARSVPGLV